MNATATAAPVDTALDPCTITSLQGKAARDALARLARFHYRCGTPRAPARVLAAMDERATPVGILCVAFPALNAPWRTTAWPDLFGHSHAHRARADLCNSHVRTIARVIIDPRWRGMGLAVRLVCAYLRAPDTPCTEAVASMARFCPLFDRAGMRRVDTAPSRRDARLAHVLRSLAIDAPSLTDISAAHRALRTHPALAAAVLTWANDSRATRHRTPTTPRDTAALTTLAAQSAAHGGPLVFVSP